MLLTVCSYQPTKFVREVENTRCGEMGMVVRSIGAVPADLSLEIFLCFFAQAGVADEGQCWLVRLYGRPSEHVRQPVVNERMVCPYLKLRI